MYNLIGTIPVRSDTYHTRLLYSYSYSTRTCTGTCTAAILDYEYEYCTSTVLVPLPTAHRPLPTAYCSTVPVQYCLYCPLRWMPSCLRSSAYCKYCTRTRKDILRIKRYSTGSCAFFSTTVLYSIAYDNLYTVLPSLLPATVPVRRLPACFSTCYLYLLPTT